MPNSNGSAGTQEARPPDGLSRTGEPNGVLVELSPALGGPRKSVEVIDVPSNIDSRLNAFVIVAAAELPAVIIAFDPDGKAVAQETIAGGPEDLSS